MTDILTLDDLADLAEGVDLECKKSLGKDGQGVLPEDFWKSYSAMANGAGGTILLGIQEKPIGTFTALGIPDLERLRKDLWDNLNNRQKVSANLLAEQHVQPVWIDGKTILRVIVPRAPRQIKPVYLGANPFGGTYLRRHEGDYPADDETVRRMLAERIEDSRDEKVLRHFGIEDLDMETVAAYRNRFSAVKPGHVWTDLALPEFLERIGVIGKNREEGFTGLRSAGLLMFGRAEVIRDALPYYMVDYQERPEAKTERRWVDRLVPDGTWSGNLYDFFRKVYAKLTADLKVPFQLHDGQRIEDTPVHEALREALVNTLIHADYSGRAPILVVKRPDLFGFRNPGHMRIPAKDAISGGTSDCRNRRIQTMFQLVGYGDHAGSGMPKIYHNWAEESLRRPILVEKAEPEQTILELHNSTLLPVGVLEQLGAMFGDKFLMLSDIERTALATAQIEGVLNHARLKEFTAEHRTDLTQILRKLVRDGYLVGNGSGRGTVYYLPWLEPVGVVDGDSEAPYPVVEDAKDRNESAESGLIPTKLEPISTKLPGIPTKQLSDWVEMDSGLKDELQAIAASVRGQKRVPPEQTEEVILSLCTGRYLGRQLIANLLERSPKDLFNRFLKPMVEAGKLKQAYPTSQHPKQAYTRVTPEEPTP